MSANALMGWQYYLVREMSPRVTVEEQQHVCKFLTFYTTKVSSESVLAKA